MIFSKVYHPALKITERYLMNLKFLHKVRQLNHFLIVFLIHQSLIITLILNYLKENKSINNGPFLNHHPHYKKHQHLYLLLLQLNHRQYNQELKNQNCLLKRMLSFKLKLYFLQDLIKFHMVLNIILKKMIMHNRRNINIQLHITLQLNLFQKSHRLLHSNYLKILIAQLENLFQMIQKHAIFSQAVILYVQD